MNWRPAFLARFHFACPAPADPWLEGLDARLAARRAMRAQRSDAAKRGHRTRRENRHV